MGLCKRTLWEFRGTRKPYLVVPGRRAACAARGGMIGPLAGGGLASVCRLGAEGHHGDHAAGPHLFEEGVGAPG